MSKSNLRFQFLNCHVRDMIVVLEEGNHPLPCLTKCVMFVHWEALNGMHHYTDMCSRGAEQKLRRRRDKKAQEIMAVSFQAYIRSLEKVNTLKYLVRVITASDDDWTLVVANISEARMKWERFSSTLEGEGTDPGSLETV